MRQAGLKLKMSIQNVSITNNNVAVERMMLHSMLFVLASLAFWYVLALGNMVYDIVERKSLEKEALSLANEVGQLELSYLSTAEDLDLPLSYKMGFKEAKASFTTRKSLGSLSFGSNEI